MTSKPAAAAPSKRQSSTSSPAAAKPQCRIHPTAVVADRAQITGSYAVEIGENVIIHPYAKIRAENGNVSIGNNCIIAEEAVVGGGEAADVVVGEGVRIESGAVIEAQKVGERTEVGVKARVRAGAVLGRWCKVVALGVVGKGEVLEDFTVVFGDGAGRRRVDVVGRERKEVREARVKGRGMEVELLKGIIPDGKAKWMG